MDLPPIIRQLDDYLKGWPDSALTALLIGLAMLIIVLALVAPPIVKAAVAAWVIAP